MATSGITMEFNSTNPNRPTALSFDERLSARPELVGWWVADTGRVTLASGVVSGIADRSNKGNNAVQNTASQRPIWSPTGGSGNRPYLDLDRTNLKSLSLGSIMPTGAGAKWTKVISVYIPTPVGSSEAHDIMSGGTTGSSTVGLHRLNVRNTNQLYCRVGIDSARVEMVQTPIFGEWMLLINSWNDDDKRLRLSINGGTFYESSSVSGASCTEATTVIGRCGLGNAFLGRVGPAMLFNVDLSRPDQSGLLGVVKEFYRNREGMTIS